MSTAEIQKTPLRGIIVVFLAFVLLHAATIFSGLTPVHDGFLSDTDAYMRVLRVESLVNGQDWYDSSVPRMNAPYGDVLHWTRPLDVLIIATALPFHYLADMDWHKAIFWGGSLLPPVMHILFGLSMVWMARPYLMRGTGTLLFLMVCMQPVVLLYNMAGRPDHQTLMMISAAMLMGHLLRLIRWPVDPLRTGFHAGLWAGFGLWVGLEFQFSFGIIVATLGLLWLWRGDDRLLQFLETLSLGFFLMVGAAVWIERGSAWNMVRELDKISLSQLIAATLNCALWGLVAWSAGGRGWLRRFLSLGALGALALCGISLLAPELLRGPGGDIDPRVAKEFVNNAAEMRPLWPKDMNGAGLLLLFIGAPLSGLVMWAIFLFKKDRTAGLVLAVYAAFFSALAVLHARFAQFAVPFGVVLQLSMLNGIEERFKPLTRFFIITLGLVGTLQLGAILVVLAPEPPPDHVNCRPSAVVDFLNRQPEGIIMADLNFGPQLLYFTKHSVVSGPYHRNRDGILDSIDFFSKPPSREAREIARKRGLTYVLACADRDADEGSLVNLLAKDQPPAWLKPMKIEESGGFHLYKVDLSH